MERDNEAFDGTNGPVNEVTLNLGGRFILPGKDGKPDTVIEFISGTNGGVVRLGIEASDRVEIKVPSPEQGAPEFLIAGAGELNGKTPSPVTGISEEDKDWIEALDQRS